MCVQDTIGFNFDLRTRKRILIFHTYCYIFLCFHLFNNKFNHINNELNWSNCCFLFWMRFVFANFIINVLVVYNGKATTQTITVSFCEQTKAKKQNDNEKIKKKTECKQNSDV